MILIPIVLAVQVVLTEKKEKRFIASSTLKAQRNLFELRDLKRKRRKTKRKKDPYKI